MVGEANNAEQARVKMEELKPDLLFLDVQMPGESGLDFLETMEPPTPRVIFTTAYDEFAVKAFELNAVDYLMKPVDPRRLSAALERLREREGTPIHSAERPEILRAKDKVFVREGDHCWFVEVNRIRLLEHEGNYTRVHFDDAQPQFPLLFGRRAGRMDHRRGNRRGRGGGKHATGEWVLPDVGLEHGGSVSFGDD